MGASIFWYWKIGKIALELGGKQVWEGKWRVLFWKFQINRVGEDITLTEKTYFSKLEREWIRVTDLAEQNCNLLSYREGYQEKKQSDLLSHISEGWWHWGIPAVRGEVRNRAERAWWKSLYSVQIPRIFSATCATTTCAFSLLFPVCPSLLLPNTRPFCPREIKLGI